MLFLDLGQKKTFFIDFSFSNIIQSTCLLPSYISYVLYIKIGKYVVYGIQDFLADAQRSKEMQLEKTQKQKKCMTAASTYFESYLRRKNQRKKCFFAQRSKNSTDVSCMTQIPFDVNFNFSSS